MWETVLVFLLLVGSVGGQECPVGMYGDNCELNCSPHCAPYDGQKVYCDKQSGKCSEGCLPGKYGDRCHLTCSKNCRKNICSVQTGHCVQGCVGNNTGQFCETFRGGQAKPEPGSKQTKKASQDSPSSPLVPILVPVLVITIIIIIIAVIVLYMWRRKYQRKRPDDAECEVLNPGGADTDLHDACKGGNLQRVRDILDHSLEDMDKKGDRCMTPVMWAARRGHRELVDILVKKGADLTLVDNGGNNILHWACYGKNVTMVKHVISKNMADINCRGQDGRTPLMCAAAQGNIDIFKLLVSKGGLPLEKDRHGNNILHLACWNGDVEIVDYILSHDDMDINGRGHSGRTPLMAAAHKGHGKIFDLLVTKGADLNDVDDAGDNVLHVACLGGHLDSVGRVLELDKVDINSRGQCSRTPLMMAVRIEDKEIFVSLVKEGADTTLEDDDGNTILHHASGGGHLDIVKYVLDVTNVDINARNKHDETATMLATKGGDVCNLLVQRGGLMK